MASGKCQHLLLPLNWLKLCSRALSCKSGPIVRSLPLLLDGPGRRFKCQLSHFPTFISPVSCCFVPLHWNPAKSPATTLFFSSQKFNSNSFFSVCSFPPSAKLGHRLYRLCGDHPGVSVLLLRLQKMDIQEEKQKEGQRQGQKCHQHEGRQGWGQNRGKDFELSLKFRDISLRTC